MAKSVKLLLKNWDVSYLSYERKDCKGKNVTIVVSLYLSHLLLAVDHADGFSIPDPAKLGCASVRVSRGHSAPGRCGRSGSTGV